MCAGNHAPFDGTRVDIQHQSGKALLSELRASQARPFSGVSYILIASGQSFGHRGGALGAYRTKTTLSPSFLIIGIISFLFRLVSLSLLLFFFFPRFSFQGDYSSRF
jgi:hypothetical protein